MAKKSLTKEEKYLLAIYEEALLSDDLYRPINVVTITQKCHFHDRGAVKIVRDLAQTNFIIKVGSEQIHITPHGVTLAKELMNN